MSNIATYNHHALECPSCGYLHLDCSDIFNEVEQVIEDFECENCNKTFTAQRTIVVSYIGEARKE